MMSTRREKYLIELITRCLVTSRICQRAGIRTCAMLIITIFGRYAVNTYALHVGPTRYA